MYSWEIKQLLEYRNYLLEVQEYLYILDTSPQISRVIYNSFSDNFYIETKDNLKETFKVKTKEI